MRERENEIYYVSYLGTEKVSIIDGANHRILKEIEIGSRSLKIVIDKNNNVYIASDKNGQVTWIPDLYDSEQSWNMPNNGNIQVDDLSQKLYVSNTEEVCIYDLKTGEKTGCLTDFIAADCLELDKANNRVFVLDILQNEIKVYNTSDLHLMKQYNTMSIAPCDILLESQEKYLYIANKGSNKVNKTGNVSIINLEDDSVSIIDFPKGSVITALEQSENHIFVANSGLSQIEAIDKQKKQVSHVIKTTLSIIQRLRLSPDKKTLYVMNRNAEGQSVIDKIDVLHHVILDTYYFQENNCIPYDIGIVIQREPKIDHEPFNLEKSLDIRKPENGTSILAKKVISIHQEKIMFHGVSIEVYPNELQELDISDIKFQRCRIINETIVRKIIDHRKEYSSLQYSFYIPYFIEKNDKKGQTINVEGRLEGSQKVTLYIPDEAEQRGLQFDIDTVAKPLSTPLVTNNKLQFDVSVLISTKVIVNEIVFVPFCNNDQEYNEKRREREEKVEENSNDKERI